MWIFASCRCKRNFMFVLHTYIKVNLVDFWNTKSTKWYKWTGEAITIRRFLVHSDTEYRPIEFPVSYLLQNLDQSLAFHATTLFTIGWRPVHNFLLMRAFVNFLPQNVSVVLTIKDRKSSILNTKNQPSSKF